MMIFISIICVLLFLYYLYTRNYNYWELRKVPFDKPFFIFGSFYNVATRKQHIFHRIRDIYSSFKMPYVGIFIFNQPTLVVRSPEILKKILVKDFDKFMNRKVAFNESVDSIAAHTLFSSKDTVWKNLRAKISPVFTSGKMKLMFPLMKECGVDMVTFLEKRKGQVVNVRDVTKKYAVDIISSCAFGINAYCLKDENSEILKVAMKLLDFGSFIRGFSIFCFFFAPKLVDILPLTFVDQTSADYLINIFKNTLKEREKQKILRHDLIDLLNNLKRNDTFNESYEFDDTKMASQAISFFSAGNDTTSLTITLTLYELALNKEIQNRLKKEVNDINKKYGDLNYEAIQDMKYLDLCLNETLRKYPLTSFLNRESTASYTFEEAGFTLDKGVSILVPIAGLHYDPEYFPDPEKYDPERFNDENKHKIVPYSYLPFGDGPRNCIGQRFGILASKVALAYCLKNFTFERADATSVPLQLNTGALFLQNEGGIQLNVVDA